jgi:hypothetical protein
VEVEEAEGSIIQAVVETPAGPLRLLASVAIVGRVLLLDGAHVGGLAPGAIGRAGLNAVGRKLLEVADVDQIIIQGSARTTGKRKGNIPRPIRFPSPAAPDTC